jgi:type IV pilus assembly protein PilZ
MSLTIRERSGLYAAYMPFLQNGGIFIPGNRPCQLGEEVFLLLSLMQDEARYPVAGKVAWITPARATGNRTQGVGVRFPSDDKTQQLKMRIEQILGAHLASDRPTQTL